tara:strand:- start:48 stop:608 length:561 start_codon:yes stop_codon:yes gene_type:complete
MTVFNRAFSMPNKDTFSMKPVKDFVEHWIDTVYTDYHYAAIDTAIDKPVVIDPFARNSKYGTITNDLNPDTDAQYHMKADEFLDMLLDSGEQADVVLYDPPYSPRQISECYSASGIKTTQQDTQSSFYTKIKDRIRPLVKPNGIVLSFGWNSMGVGKKFGKYEEILLLTHGGAHNDTICVAQRKDI